PDPLAYLPEPTQPPDGLMTKVPLGNGNFNYILSPGTYWALPNFNQGDVVTLQQASAGNGGIFYIANGGFNSQGANIVMDPTTTGGIMFYNAGTNTNDGFNIAGNPKGVVNIGPLTDGIYKGITFFQNRAATEAMNISGNGDFTIKGTLYLAGAQLQVTG